MNQATFVFGLQTREGCPPEYDTLCARRSAIHGRGQEIDHPKR